MDFFNEITNAMHVDYCNGENIRFEVLKGISVHCTIELERHDELQLFKQRIEAFENSACDEMQLLKQRIEALEAH